MRLCRFTIRVTCDLIPLAVLKRRLVVLGRDLDLVTCDLIPLAVLKRSDRKAARETAAFVTCDLIPLAVLKPRDVVSVLILHRLSHVTSYRLRY